MPEPPNDDPVIEPGTYPHPLLELDAAGTVRWCNPAAADLASRDGADRPHEDSSPVAGGDLDTTGSSSEPGDRCREILPDAIEEIVRRCLESGEDLDGMLASVGDRTFSWCFRPVRIRNSVAGFGFDVTSWKESESALPPSLPVLFISGFPGQRAPDLPLADEPLDFLPEPFTHEQLLQRVRERLDEGAAAE